MTDSKPKRRYLTQKEFIRIARKVVREKGRDFVYGRPFNASYCVNVDTQGNPSCIMGHILIEWDPSLADLLNRDGNRAAAFGELLLNRLDIDTSDRVLNAGLRMQRMQDQGRSWGESLSAGLKYFNSRSYND